MMKITEVSTPLTLKTFTTSRGDEYILKGADKSVQYPNSSYVSDYFKLYKKAKVDGMDTFQLLGKKEEKYLVNGRKHFVSITKENYNPSTGVLTEQSCISQNVFGGKNIECCGDVFKLQGSVSTNFKNDKAVVAFDTTKGKLTPIAKRILKLITK